MRRKIPSSRVFDVLWFSSDSAVM